MLCMKMIDGEVVIYDDPDMDSVFDRLKDDLKTDGIDLDDDGCCATLLEAAFID